MCGARASMLSRFGAAALQFLHRKSTQMETISICTSLYAIWKQEKAQTIAPPRHRRTKPVAESNQRTSGPTDFNNIIDPITKKEQKREKTKNQYVPMGEHERCKYPHSLALSLSVFCPNKFFGAISTGFVKCSQPTALRVSCSFNLVAVGMNAEHFETWQTAGRAGRRAGWYSMQSGEREIGKWNFFFWVCSSNCRRDAFAKWRWTINVSHLACIGGQQLALAHTHTPPTLCMSMEAKGGNITFISFSSSSFSLFFIYPLTFVIH